MVRAIERIEQEISALEQAIAATAAKLHQAYSNYLTQLGQATRQQLILACYYLCTQGYPEQFLQLPFSQRQQLQQDLKRLAQQTQQTLEECLTPLSAAEEDTENSPGQPPASPLEPLGRWQVHLERSLHGQLRVASKKANQKLTEVGILAGNLPEPILEAAVKSEASGELMPGPPNILSVMIDADLPRLDDPEEEDPEAENEAEEAGDSDFPLRIMALRLRLSDLEFADPTLMNGRTQIRNLLARLAGLDREYQKKQQERAIAAAEAAWRSTWTDEL